MVTVLTRELSLLAGKRICCCGDSGGRNGGGGGDGSSVCSDTGAA